MSYYDDGLTMFFSLFFFKFFFFCVSVSVSVFILDLFKFFFAVWLVYIICFGCLFVLSPFLQKIFRLGFVSIPCIDLFIVLWWYCIVDSVWLIVVIGHEFHNVGRWYSYWNMIVFTLLTFACIFCMITTNSHTMINHFNFIFGCPEKERNKNWIENLINKRPTRKRKMDNIQQTFRYVNKTACWPIAYGPIKILAHRERVQ